MGRLTDEELWDRYQTELREIYDRKRLEKPIYPLFHLVRGYFQGSAFPIQVKAVEIGFGNGGLLMSLAASIFTDCYGLDISKRNIELTASQFKEAGITNVHFEQYNILTTPRHSDFFDVLVLSHVLEHFDDEEIGTVLSNVRTMLRAEGIFFGATPYKKDLNPRICPNCGHVFEIDHHKQVFDDEQMKSLLEGNGFRALLVRHFSPDHHYLGRSFLDRLFDRISNRDLVTQLEFIAVPKR